ncbi:MAG: hypothetical protein ACOZAN_01085 [Patescibacteria group bacterium]
MKKLNFPRLAQAFLLAFLMCFLLVSQVKAEAEVLGVHVLHPHEIDQANELVADESSEKWHYLTIPFSLEDLNRKDEWKNFFQQAKEKRIIPIVRLVTKFENGSWKRPNRREVTQQISFLSELEWPTEQKTLIIFNEVNHASEWGGQVDPESYTRVLRFASQWAHAEDPGFVVLPAAMDLAAPNGGSTMEAFNYLESMYKYDSQIFSYLDAWNSHSYPNPGFSSSPERDTKNSLRGFLHELAFLREKTGRDFKVYITETGWVANGGTVRWLESYYLYALQHIWNNPQVVAVTPFLLKGDPGPFAGFGFLDRNDKPTAQYMALQAALEKLRKGKS